ncbi:MAG TPA: hypothetical protein VH986_13990 [Acidimicrobiia bacterium]|jgi:hypothetical protein
MPDRSRARRVLGSLRGALLVIGVGTMTVALVGFLDSEFVLVGVEPWWHVGLAGIAAALIALGSPWTAGIGPD